jgi:hypothetical protein
MSRHHKLLIAATFLMGFVTGVFGYFWSKSSDDTGAQILNIDTPNEERGFEVLLTAYGGCERIGCPSLRLLTDGSYQYLAPRSVRDYGKYEDVISPNQRETLTQLISETPFAELTETQFEGTCPVVYDGLAYRIEVRVESNRYSLDTCVENINNEPLTIELIRYFDIMEATHGGS